MRQIVHKRATRTRQSAESDIRNISFSSSDSPSIIFSLLCPAGNSFELVSVVKTEVIDDVFVAISEVVDNDVEVIVVVEVSTGMKSVLIFIFTNRYFV